VVAERTKQTTHEQAIHFLVSIKSGATAHTLVALSLHLHKHKHTLKELVAKFAQVENICDTLSDKPLCASQ
jgi:hypothetical protein